MKVPENLHHMPDMSVKSYALNTPRTPSTLSKEAGRWWKKLIQEYGIDDDYGYLLLQTALEAFDRMRQAQAVIAKEGMTYIDRYDQAKCHPATVVEKDSRSQMLTSFKALNLDIEPLGKAGRKSVG